MWVECRRHMGGEGEKSGAKNGSVEGAEERFMRVEWRLKTGMRKPEAERSGKRKREESEGSVGRV